MESVIARHLPGWLEAEALAGASAVPDGAVAGPSVRGAAEEPFGPRLAQIDAAIVRFRAKLEAEAAEQERATEVEATTALPAAGWTAAAPWAVRMFLLYVASMILSLGVIAALGRELSPAR